MEEILARAKLTSLQALWSAQPADPTNLAQISQELDALKQKTDLSDETRLEISRFKILIVGGTIGVAVKNAGQVFGKFGQAIASCISSASRDT